MSTPYAHKSSTARRTVAAIAGFLLVSALIVRASDAAFTADYVNEGNEFATAVIDLDGTTTPLFGDGDTATIHALDMYPGSEVSGCIEVTYDGSLDAADLSGVTVSILTDDATGDLAAADLSVDVALHDGDCDDPIDATFVTGAALDGVAAQGSGWTPDTDGDVRGFTFTVTLDATTAAEMGDGIDGVDLLWELETASN